MTPRPAWWLAPTLATMLPLASAIAADGTALLVHAELYRGNERVGEATARIPGGATGPVWLAFPDDHLLATYHVSLAFVDRDGIVVVQPHVLDPDGLFQPRPPERLRIDGDGPQHAIVPVGGLAIADAIRRAGTWRAVLLLRRVRDRH